MIVMSDPNVPMSDVRLARLELPDLTLWNRTGEHVFVLPQTARLYRTPTIDSFVKQTYVHLLRFAHGRRCLTFRSAAGCEHREHVARCSWKFDAGRANPNEVHRSMT